MHENITKKSEKELLPLRTQLGTSEIQADTLLSKVTWQVLVQGLFTLGDNDVFFFLSSCANSYIDDNTNHP